MNNYELERDLILRANLSLETKLLGYFACITSVLSPYFLFLGRNLPNQVLPEYREQVESNLKVLPIICGFFFILGLVAAYVFWKRFKVAQFSLRSLQEAYAQTKAETEQTLGEFDETNSVFVAKRYAEIFGHRCILFKNDPAYPLIWGKSVKPNSKARTGAIVAFGKPRPLVDEENTVRVSSKSPQIEKTIRTIFRYAIEQKSFWLFVALNPLFLVVLINLFSLGKAQGNPQVAHWMSYLGIPFLLIWIALSFKITAKITSQFIQGSEIRALDLFRWEFSFCLGTAVLFAPIGWFIIGRVMLNPMIAQVGAKGASIAHTVSWELALFYWLYLFLNALYVASGLAISAIKRSPARIKEVLTNLRQNYIPIALCVLFYVSSDLIYTVRHWALSALNLTQFEESNRMLLAFVDSIPKLIVSYITPIFFAYLAVCAEKKMNEN